VIASLAALPTLASLTIAFRLEQGYDNSTILCARCCMSAPAARLYYRLPPLHHSECTVSPVPPAIPIPRRVLNYPALFTTKETFTRCVRPLGQLRTLALRIVPSSGEDDLRTCGTRIVRASPRLTSFELVFLARTGAQTLTGPAVRVRGKFVLAADTHGLPLALHVVERRTCLLWPRESVRRATLEMRPAGTPGTRRTPLLALVLERSPAGEEARLLMFCVVLLAVVIWGCIKL